MSVSSASLPGSVVHRCLLCLGLLCAFTLVSPAGGGAADPAVLKFSRTMPANALAGRADTDLVELSNGRKIMVGDVRKLTALAGKLRAATPGSRAPAALRMKPAAKGVPLRNAADITSALKRPDAETVQLPSGKTLTVGQMKLVQAEVERQLGHSLASLPQRPDLTGPTTPVGRNPDWQTLLKRPDNTILQAPDGTLITVGELKQTLAASATKSAPRLRAR